MEAFVQSDAYYEIPSNEAGLSKTWKYRVVEVDANGKVIEDEQNITINNHNYQVGNRFDTEKQTWVITNTLTGLDRQQGGGRKSRRPYQRVCV